MNEQIFSVVRDGRWACPVCKARFHELAEKKRHIKAEHPKKVRS